MEKRFIAQRLIYRLNEKIRSQLSLHQTLILGVVLKGLPVAYGLAKMNDVTENFVPLVAQRHIHMQHHVESYFPSSDWKAYFSKILGQCDSILIVDDVVNTGFTRQKVESIVQSLEEQLGKLQPIRFAALVLNRKNLANSSFVSPGDFYASEVKAVNVECDWGLITVPLWDLSVEKSRQRCDGYYQKFWVGEQRRLTIAY